MPVASPSLRWHETVDVGIVGAGGCGLTAAHAAAANDVSVSIWEKAKCAGGSTALSSGKLPAAGTRIQRDAGIADTAEDFARDVLQRNGGGGDAALTRSLCASSAALVDWLVAERGIGLDLVTKGADPGHSQPRLHAPAARTGQVLIDGLLRTLTRRRIALRLGAAVTQLWTDADGAVLGVQVKLPKRSAINVRCTKLILANDGFGAQPELVADHCPDAAGLPYAGVATSNGDALAWSSDVAAATRHLGSYQAHATMALGSNLLIPWSAIASGAILVNQRGERFADESRGPGALAAALRTQPGCVAYEILGAAALQELNAIEPYFAAEIAPRTLRRAEELSHLANQFELDPDTLQRTVSAYNAAINGGGDPFGRTSVGPPLAAPFFGIRVGAALLQTEGGFAIDAGARVLRTDGTPIPNLYAGGGAAAGLSAAGGSGYLEGNGLLCALGWGKIAGEQARQEIIAARGTEAAAPDSPEDERQ